MSAASFAFTWLLLAAKVLSGFEGDVFSTHFFPKGKLKLGPS